MNKSSSTAIELTFDEVDSFTNGTIWIRIGQKVGYVDRTGKFCNKQLYFSHLREKDWDRRSRSFLIYN